MTNDFPQDLAYSLEQEKEPWWEHVYRQAFPGFTGIEHVTDLDRQRAGIDVILTWESGRLCRIDEKVRRGAWDDILLEVWSVWYGQRDPRNKYGWAWKDQDTDFIAYAFPATRTAHILPFPELWAALRANCQEWYQRYEEVTAQNKGYTTRSLAIPTPTLLNLTGGRTYNWPLGLNKCQVAYWGFDKCDAEATHDAYCVTHYPTRKATP
jgi:hypothetical protein